MRLAAEAIQDSERIMIGRQRLDNIANIDIDKNRDLNRRHANPADPMKTSLEVQNKLVWDGSAGEDFSVFAPRDAHLRQL